GGLLSTATQNDPDGAGPLPTPVTSYTYDLQGRVSEITRPGGLVTSYSYDATGRVSSIEASDGSETDFVTPQVAALDGGEFIETVTDSRGVATATKYDPLGNVTLEVDALGNETEYVRDA